MFRPKVAQAVNNKWQICTMVSKSWYRKDSLEDIKKREQITRDFYCDWKERTRHSKSSIYHEDVLWRKSSIALLLSPASKMKKASQTRCLTFALMRGGGLRPRVWCDAGGDFALPITSSYHDLLIMLQRYAVSLYLQGLYFSTSTRCIKMGTYHLTTFLYFIYLLNVGMNLISNNDVLRK